VLRSQQRPYWGFDDRGDWRYFDYTSGLVDTRGKFPFVYGRVDIRAKLPGTRGLWPAHWMLSQTGAWPPEIDITEMTGDLPNRIVTSLHWGPLPPGTYPWDIGQTASSVHWGPDYTQGFHNYSMEWLPGLLNFYIDDTVRFSVSRDEIPDETMYLILNTAVGGDWPGSPDGSTILPQFHVLEVIATELLLELLNATRRIDELLRASKERVTGRADFDRDLLDGAAGRKRVAATAAYGRFRKIFRVNLFFHRCHILLGEPSPPVAIAERLSLTVFRRITRFMASNSDGAMCGASGANVQHLAGDHHG